MSERASLVLHACLLAASVATVLLVTASLVPRAADGLRVPNKDTQFASASLPALVGPGDLVKDESRVPIRE